MTVDDAQSARGLAVPSCLKCQSDEVRPLNVSELDPVVHYWSCEACGFVWATRDDDVRSIAAERTPRKLA